MVGSNKCIMKTVKRVCDGEFSEEEIRKFENAKHPQLTRKLLCYSHLSKEKILTYFSILQEVEDLELAHCMIDIMVNNSVNKRDLVEEALEILKSSHKDFQRDYQRKVLVNEIAIKEGMSFPLAHQICYSENSFNAKAISEFAFHVENMEYLDVLSCASCFNGAKTEEKVESMLKVLRNRRYLDEQIAVPLIQTIALAQEDFQMEDINYLFDKNINPLVLMAGIKLITESKDEKESKRITSYLPSITLRDIYPFMDQEVNLTKAVEKRMEKIKKQPR